MTDVIVGMGNVRARACILATGGIGNLHVGVLVGRIGVTVNITIEAVDLDAVMNFCTVEGDL